VITKHKIQLNGGAVFKRIKAIKICKNMNKYGDDQVSLVGYFYSSGINRRNRS
jgi:hypothetical protein